MASDHSVDRPVLITVIFSLIVLLGGFLALQLSIALYPDFSEPSVSIYTVVPNASPETVEQSVTRVLESSLENINGIRKMTSISSSGVSQIDLAFDWGKNVEAATNDVRDVLGSVTADLPKGVKSPQIFKFNAGSFPIMEIALQGDRSPEEMLKIAKTRVVNQLRKIDGVSDASVSGGRSAAIRVDVSQERLDAYGLTLSAVSAALAAQNLELGGGKITEQTKDLAVRTTGEFTSLEEIKEAVVAQRRGYGVQLKDIAEVGLGYRDEESHVLVNGKAGIYISIKKKSGGNTVKIASGVAKALPEIEKLLPPGVKLTILSDDSRQIMATVDTLIHAAIEAIVFAMLVIFLFLRSAKTTWIIGLSIPISIAATLLVMALAGISLNIFTMTGLILGVGMIVDDSIVVMENIVRYRERGLKNRVAAVLGSQEIRRAVIASTLTTILVFVPFLIFKNKLDILGILFQDMLITIVISLLSSLAVALFLVPVLISHYFPLAHRTGPIPNPILFWGDKILDAPVRGLSVVYRGLLRWILNHRGPFLATMAVLLVTSISTAALLKIEFSPETTRDSVTLNIELPLGTRLQETKKIVAELEAFSRQEIKGFETIIATSGTDGTHRGSIQVILPPKARQFDGPDTVKAVLQRRFNDYPSARFSFSKGEELSGVSAAITIQVQSDDMQKAIKTSQMIVDLLRTNVPEATEVASDAKLGMPQVQVDVDRKRAAAFGVDVATVATEINAAVAGVTATQYHQDGTDYDVLIILRESDRGKVFDLNNISVLGTSGNRVSLASIAELRRGDGPVSIAHENKSRVIRVTANTLPNVSIPEVERKVRQEIARGIVSDPAVTLNYKGEQAALENTGAIMLIVIIMAIVLIFGTMAAQYESWKDPLINLFTIPFVVTGVVIVYGLAGQPVSMFTALGLLMLIGIVVKNGIVMVDYTNLLRARGCNLKEACIEAGVTRLRPVLMTSLTAILGMIPLAFNHGEGGELVQPIGLTVIGGLTSSTMVTLFLVPVVYSIINREKTKKRVN